MQTQKTFQTPLLISLDRFICHVSVSLSLVSLGLDHFLYIFLLLLSHSLFIYIFIFFCIVCDCMYKSFNPFWVSQCKVTIGSRFISCQSRRNEQQRHTHYFVNIFFKRLLRSVLVYFGTFAIAIKLKQTFFWRSMDSSKDFTF